MRYAESSVSNGVEILASNDYQAIPVTVAGNDVLKAGTPITEGGESTTGANAIGILLYDVDPTANPNGAAVVAGIIDATKAQAYSGVTYAVADLAAALPAVYLRTNI